MEKDYGQIFLSYLKEVYLPNGKRIDKDTAGKILKFFLIVVKDIEFGKTEAAKSSKGKEPLDIEGCSEEIIKMFKEHPDLEDSVYKEYIKYIFLKIEESKKTTSEKTEVEKVSKTETAKTKGTKNSKGGK